jgi:hypothetical protein
VQVIDWSDPYNPSVATTVSSNFVGSPQEIEVRGKYLFVSETTGVRTLDISDPRTPVLIQRDSTGFNTNILHVAGDLVATSNESANPGLIRLYQLQTLETNGLRAASADLGALTVLTNATVGNQFTVAGDLTVGAGGILSNGVLGVYTSTTNATSTLFVNTASNTAPVLEILGGCDNGSSTGTGKLLAAGNFTDRRKFHVMCNGNVFADGTVSSPAADFAEYLASDGSLAPQDVLVLDASSTIPAVKKSSLADRSLTIGVYSMTPSFIGGATEEILDGTATSTYVPVAILGQVLTNASAETGAIAPGDELMAGDGGRAVKARGPGMVLGRALDPLASGTGAIRVFVAPHWSAGDLLTTLDASTSSAALTDDLFVTTNVDATASSTAVDSPALLFRGSAWDASSSTALTSSFRLFADIVDATSSFLTFQNGSGTNLLTVSNAGDLSVTGDLTVGRRLFLGSKTTGQGSLATYLFVDDTQAPSSTYIATNADGWSTSSTYDYAERYFSHEPLVPGDVVVIDPSTKEYVKKSASLQDVPVGIVSTKPGFITGGYLKDTYPIALAGRVPTRVSTGNGPILIGDPLRSSAIPGVAEKATGPSHIVGIALESYDLPDVGLISVFVKPGFSMGSLASNGSLSSSEQTSITNVFTQNPERRQGLAKIYAGETSVHVTFPTLQAYPVVHVRPYGAIGESYWVSDVGDDGFTVVLSAPASAERTFSWIARPSASGDTMSFSDNTSLPYDPQSGQPVGPVLPPPDEAATGSATTTE